MILPLLSKICKCFKRINCYEKDYIIIGHAAIGCLMLVRRSRIPRYQVYKIV